MPMLTVSDDTIVSNLKIGPGKVKVTYDFQGPAGEVRKRRLTESSPQGGPWEKCNGFNSGSPHADWFEETILPGTFWQFGAFVEGASDPDESYGEESFPTVCGVSQYDPLAVKIGGDESQKMVVGGTYVSLEIETELPTFARLWISNAVTAVPNNSGRPRMPAPVGSIHVTRQNLGRRHRFLEVPLGAGTAYGFVLQLIDTRGAEMHIGQLGTQIGPLKGAFRTLQRKVTVSIDKITVLNDGDPIDTGEAEFVIYTFKNDQPVAGAPFRIGDDNAPIIISDNQGDARSKIETRMPDVVIDEPGDFQVGVNVHGREFDGILENDELASTGRAENEKRTGIDSSNAGNLALFMPTYVPFRIGEAEHLDSTAQEIKLVASTVNKTNFEFSVVGKFTAVYR